MSVGELISLSMTGATLVLAYVVWKSSQRIARAQYQQTMQGTWNQFNLAAIDCEENIRAVRWLWSTDERERPPDVSKERTMYLAFLALNALTSAQLGKKAGVMDASYADKNEADLLPRLVVKDEIFYLTQHCGYHPEFEAACARLRGKLLPEESAAALPSGRALSAQKIEASVSQPTREAVRL